MASKHSAERASKAGFATKAIHVGQVPDPSTRAVVTVRQSGEAICPSEGAGVNLTHGKSTENRSRR